MKTALLENFVKMELSNKIAKLAKENPALDEQGLQEKIDDVLDAYIIKEAVKCPA